MDLRLWVHLGCSEQEKFHPQCVSFDIDITFANAFRAVSSDDLADSFCYAGAVELIKHALKGKRFNLIEHLAYVVYEVLFESLKENGFKSAELSVKLAKLSPPVPDIHGGVSFTYSG